MNKESGGEKSSPEKNLRDGFALLRQSWVVALTCPPACHSLPLPSNPPLTHKKYPYNNVVRIFLVERDGFEPSKAVPTDLQSAPFGHSGTSPKNGAGDGTRTRDLLITNQLLYQLSYTSILVGVTGLEPVTSCL